MRSTSPFESVERMFDQLRRDMFELQSSLSESWPALEVPRFGTAVDLAEHDDAYVLTVDMPGFERDEIDLRYHDGMIWVTAEHESGDETGARRRSLSEQVSVPREVDVESISASYHNGVLEIHLPVLADADEHGHRIDID